MSQSQVRGRCEARFEAVRNAFEENFGERDELGAAVTVTLHGQTVVDLWGGWADAERTRPWERDTVVNVWSTTKGATALCAHILADRGLLDLDAPVAAYWPEFAAAGKEGVLVRHLLSHRAGLAGPREPLSFEQFCDWELTVKRLAAQEPWWEPGTRSGYHATTFGFLVGEVVRRVSGLLPSAFLAREVTGPLDIDFTIGLPDAEAARAAELVHPPTATSSEQAAVFAQLTPTALAALANPLVGAAEANTPGGGPPRSRPPTVTAPRGRSPRCTGSSRCAAPGAGGGCCRRRRPSGSARARVPAVTWCSAPGSAGTLRSGSGCG